MKLFKKKKSLFASNVRLGFYKEILNLYMYNPKQQSLFGCLNLRYKSEKYLIESIDGATTDDFVKRNFPEFYAQRPKILAFDFSGGWWPDGDYDSRIEAFKNAIALTEKHIKENGITRCLRFGNILKLLYRCLPGRKNS